MVISFGLINAPATFQALINNVLRKYLDIFIIVYLNNILIYSKTEKKHVNHITQVLQTLQESDLQVKLEKSIFHAKEVNYLGYIILDNGVKINPIKIRTVQE